MKIVEAIAQVIEGVDISEVDMHSVMGQIMTGEATPVQIGSFLTALRMKGETIEEITGAAKVMREKVTPIDSGVDISGGDILLDTCGTGGDGSGTFNVSTTSALVVAGCGVTVAKHGNRSVSSSCGSADVLEAVGVNLSIKADQVGQCIQEVGIGFLFAPSLHGAMKYAIGPRREIGVRTIFNVLGPLTNPAGANVQVLGVFSEDLTDPIANVLAKLGSLRALVVHGEGNLDELTLTGQTRISELKDGMVNSYTIKPEQFGLKRCELGDLRGGNTSEEAALIMKRILDGELGPRREMTLLNSGAALMATGTCQDLSSGIALAADSIDSGKAKSKLEQLITYTNSISSSPEA